jgi:hypothetical protein
MNKSYLFFPLFVFLLCGCQSSFGPRALKYTHPAYNQVIVNTLDQQMLLNLVRLKYRDSAFFLNVNSVTASFSMGAAIGVDAELPWDFDQDGVRLGDGRVVSPNVGMSYSQSPTISYTPLQGEEFLENVLTPIPIEALLILTQSGWRIDRVFSTCVERINTLNNAPRASGPTPRDEPRYKKFKRLVELLHQLQVAGLIELGPELDLTKKRRISVLFRPDPNYQSVIDEVRSLLGLTPQTNVYRFSTNFLNPKDDEWNLRTRSISSMLYYLSHNIVVPEKHKEEGLVTTTMTKDGDEFNWDQTPAGTMLKVQSTKWSRPDNAFISVPYRGAWFYIADNDLNSKSTFMLLKQLFSLQAGHIRDAGPTLTLPVGGG